MILIDQLRYTTNHVAFRGTFGQTPNDVVYVVDGDDRARRRKIFSFMCSRLLKHGGHEISCYGYRSLRDMNFTNEHCRQQEALILVQ